MSGSDPMRFVMDLPPWVAASIEPGRTYATVDDRMAFVVGLATTNVDQRTGGPFAAAVFDLESRTLVAAGVNVVVPSRSAVAHAEIVAISMAGQALGTFDLGSTGRAGTELVSSTEPCAMCLGAVPWSGVASLVVGARDEDARAVGFEEGDKPPQWEELLGARGISVTRDVLRQQAAAVLQNYVAGGGTIYNAGTGR